MKWWWMTAAVIGMCFLQGIAPAAPPVTVTASVSPAEIPHHKSTVYTIKVEAPAGLDIHIPRLNMDAEEVTVHPLNSNRETHGDRQVVQRRFSIDFVYPNTYVLPALSVSWGEEEKVQAPAMAVRVRELTEEEKEHASVFVPITYPEPVKKSKPWWLLGVIALLLALSIAFIVLLLRSRKQEEQQEEKPKPWEVAYRRLEALAQRDLPASGQFEQYYVDLSSILRFYIEDRFQLRAPEQTTPEFLEAAGGSRLLTEDQQQTLGQFLHHCDRVKFARHVPSTLAMEEHFALVKAFVQATEPVANGTESASGEVAA